MSINKQSLLNMSINKHYLSCYLCFILTCFIVKLGKYPLTTTCDRSDNIVFLKSSNSVLLDPKP